ncbi:MAG: hypothetical protein V8T16_15785 [Parabacteroides merdae]
MPDKSRKNFWNITANDTGSRLLQVDLERRTRIYRGELKDLEQIVKENNLTLTTLLVVGNAIDNRTGISRLDTRSSSVCSPSARDHLLPMRHDA